MRSRIISIFILLSIAIVVLFLIPIKRDILFKVDKSLAAGLSQVSVDFVNNGILIVSKDHYIKGNIAKYGVEISDSIRLRSGEYDLKVFLLYKNDKYIKRDMKLKIGFLDFDKIMVELL